MENRQSPWRAKFAAALVDASPDWSAALASRLMGAAARIRLPPVLGRAAVDAYARLFQVNLNDVDPLTLEEGFESFDAFFTRRLRSGARSIDRSASTVVSPCDGELRDIVRLEDTSKIVAKGHPFTLGELLADEQLAAQFEGGTATTIYLHPRDYHRVHSPTDALVRRVTVVPGRLLPVTQASQARNPRLFALNERMIHELETGLGLVVVVMVAAFGVGNMTCAYHRFEEAHPRELQIHRCDPPARVRKGDELGVFHLGSTVILLCPAGVVPSQVQPPMAVRLGEPLLEEPAQ